MILTYSTAETYREECTPVLETERLVLRAPRIEDAKTVAALANDRRVAENTLRIPHPYTFADAMQWISAANTRPGERTFVILREDDVVGACGFDLREGPEPELGYWIGAPYWSQDYATEAATRRGRLRILRGEPRRAARRRAGHAIPPRAACWRNAAFNGTASS